MSLGARSARKSWIYCHPQFTIRRHRIPAHDVYNRFGVTYCKAAITRTRIKAESFHCRSQKPGLHFKSVAHPESGQAACAQPARRCRRHSDRDIEIETLPQMSRRLLSRLVRSKPGPAASAIRQVSGCKGRSGTDLEPGQLRVACVRLSGRRPPDAGV